MKKELGINNITALIIFVDVRGFTSWAEKVGVFPFIDKFGQSFQNILKEQFLGFFKKNLGDGALLIKEFSEETNLVLLKAIIMNTVKSINKVESKFKNLCEYTAQTNGCKVDLNLGWGITKGTIKKYDSDYIGSDINKCARLCGIARPFGIVIDKDDFPILPIFRRIDVKFYHQTRKLKGFVDTIDVWVTKEIANQFLTRENIKLTPEIHVAGICFKREYDITKALLAKRSDSRKLYPNLYEGCGGQLAPNENFVAGVERHYKLEFGLDIEVYEHIHKFYYIQQPNEPIIPGIKYLCKYLKGTPLSENHTELKWMSREEVNRIQEENFIPGLKEDFLEFFDLFEKNDTLRAT